MTLHSPEVPMPPGPTITVSDVHLRYSAQQAPVLAGVNLTISAGTVYCLLGPSGAGKTSLLKVQLKQVDVVCTDNRRILCSFVFCKIIYVLLHLRRAE